MAIADLLRQIFGRQELLSPVPEKLLSPIPDRFDLPPAGKGYAYAVVQPRKKNTQSFGMGTEEAKVRPDVYDALMRIVSDPTTRANLAELSGQESSYGYAGPHISEKEESYGPLHLNLKAGRISPRTGKPFTKEEAENVDLIIQYALDEYKRTKGLGKWNPGAYDFYQHELPKRAQTKKFVRGK